jgi:catechol 2,3-dioxygenase
MAMNDSTTTLGSLPATLSLGPVHLTVVDLDRSIAWYEHSLGLTLHRRDAGIAELGDSEKASVILHEDPGAGLPGHHAKLFHYCLLFDTREELARAKLRIERTGTPTTNENDRHTHEAIYLNDPDGINIELAWDRPREFWPAEPYGHDPVPLDVEGLLATVAGEEPSDVLLDKVTVGHLHLVTGGIDESIEFYRDVLGFDLRYNVGSDDYVVHAAAFFSVGGYHHQLAANLLAGEDVGPVRTDVVGLKYWSMKLPSSADVDATRERLEANGAEVVPMRTGFMAYDPWKFALHVYA